VTASLTALTDQANRLKADGKLRAAIEQYRLTVRSFPQSAVARHNLAAALGDAGNNQEAETTIRHAMQMGLDAPQSWLVLARALQAQFRLQDAKSAFEAVLQRNPLDLDAHLELSQLIWMQSGDPVAAAAPIETAMGLNPDVPGYCFVKARVLEFTRDAASAYACLQSGLHRWPHELGLLIPASYAAIAAGAVEEALDLALRARQVGPQNREPVEVLTHACLAAGKAEQAADLAASLRASAPDDQHAIALQATAWRVLGDARYRALYDYETLVGVHDLDTPSGWPTLDRYLFDLAQELSDIHPYQTHPFGHSVRHGSQLPDVLALATPAIRAFRSAIQGPLDRHVQALGTGDDPVRRRQTGCWAVGGSWSVWLKPGGFHTDHVHPRGWLSSACYVAVPASVGAESQGGWIRFGAPGIATQPRLDAEYAIQPRPGQIVLFPSYVWHGTIPFAGEEPRLTIAMDFVPA
jgi:tetratricopeptide (TPR) repeat protein